MNDPKNITIMVALAVSAVMLFYILLRGVIVQRRNAAMPGEQPPLLPQEFPDLQVRDFVTTGVLFIAWAGLWFWGISVGEGQGSSPPEGYTWKMLLGNIQFQIVLGVIPLLLLSSRVNFLTFWGLKKTSWEEWGRILLLAVGAFFAFLFFNVILVALGYQHLVERIYGEFSQQDSIIALQKTVVLSSIVLFAVMAVIFAPLSEELLFRGYFYKMLKKAGSVKLAAVASSLLFAVIHFDAISLPRLFVLGLLLVVVYEMTQSLWAPILLHFINNLFTVALTLLIKYNPYLMQQIENYFK